MKIDNPKEQIINSAQIIFSRFGFKKSTMEEIAQAMHKGKSAIYYYFKSKEEIFEAVVEKEIILFRNEVNKISSKTDSPKEKLRLYIITRMKAFKRMSNFYEAIKSDYLRHLDFISKIRIKYDENEIKIIRELLESGNQKGEFRVEDTELAAIALVTAMKGLEAPLFWSNNNQDLEKRIDNLLSILFYGILKK